MVEMMHGLRKINTMASNRWSQLISLKSRADWFLGKFICSIQKLHSERQFGLGKVHRGARVKIVKWKRIMNHNITVLLIMLYTHN